MSSGRKLPIFRRNFLINPRVQAQIVGYMLILFGISLLALYGGLRFIQEGIEAEYLRMYPGQLELLQQLFESRRVLLNQLFLYFSGVTFLLAVAGGIFLSHRIVGPAYRIRRILEQALKGDTPETFRCRKADFFQELFPLLEKVITRRRSDGQGGFTLVELMIVVALVGILASIAGIQYQKFVSRTRQSEAKLMLSGIYTAEMSFQAEQASFTGCLRQAGYEPTNSTIRYFGGGFRGFTDECGPAGDSSCRAYSFSPILLCNTSSGFLALGDPLTSSDTAYAPSAQAYPGALVPSPFLLSLPRVNQSEFVAIAVGSISSSSGVLDTWTIDHRKTMNNVQSGL